MTKKIIRCQIFVDCSQSDLELFFKPGSQSSLLLKCPGHKVNYRVNQESNDENESCVWCDANNVMRMNGIYSVYLSIYISFNVINFWGKIYNLGSNCEMLSHAGGHVLIGMW